jgi:hypothetical protein
VTATTATAPATPATTGVTVLVVARPRHLATTLVTRPALVEVLGRQAALLAAIARPAAILESAHAEPGLAIIRTLDRLVSTHRHRRALRTAFATTLARPAVATTPPSATLVATAMLVTRTLARLAALGHRLHGRALFRTTLFARSTLARGAPTTLVAAPLATFSARGRRRTITGGARRAITGACRTVTAGALATTTILASTPWAALATAAAATIPATTIGTHPAFALLLRLAHRATRARGHPHPERAGAEAQESGRTFLHHRDHRFGARQSQRRQPLVDRFLEGAAFEDVASCIGHAIPRLGAPGSCVSTGDRRAVSEP